MNQIHICCDYNVELLLFLQDCLMDTNDTILLQRFRKGTDAEAFSQIVNLYAGIVYGACSRIIRDKDQARDVAQDTFFQLFRNASQVSGSLAGWLHTVATRKAIDIVRQDSARKAHHLEYSKSKLQQAENWDEISPYIDEALTQIDDQLRQILVKHFLEGLTMKETAEKMDISQATISRKVQAGLNEVRAILKKRGILVAAISLSALLTQNAAHAAPAALITQLGKMSIAAGATAAAASTAKAATAATVLTTIKAKVVTAVAVAAIGTGAVVTYNNVTNEPPSEPQTNQTAAIADETPTTTKTTTPSINSSDKQWQTFWN